MTHLAGASADSRASSKSWTDAALGPPDHDARFEPGDQLGPYRIDPFLGRGMGEVYEGSNISSSNDV